MKKALGYMRWIVSMLALFAPLIALSATQGGFVPLADVGSQSSKLGALYGTQGDFSAFLNGLFRFAIAIGAIGAVLRLAYAGYLYMGQSDMWSHKGQARTIIGDVTLGLLLLLAVWLILNQINPDIVKLDALRNIKPVQQTQSSTPAQSSGLSQQQLLDLNGQGGGNGYWDSFNNSYLQAQ